MKDRRYGTPEARRRANENVYRRMKAGGGRILSLRIDAEQDARLTEIASSEGTSRTAVAMRILKNGLTGWGNVETKNRSQ